MISGTVSFTYALRHLGTLGNDGLALPMPNQGLQAALLAWASVEQCTRISAHSYAQVYLHDLGLQQANRRGNDSPETFFFDLAPDPRKFLL